MQLRLPAVCWWPAPQPQDRLQHQHRHTGLHVWTESGVMSDKNIKVLPLPC